MRGSIPQGHPDALMTKRSATFARAIETVAGAPSPQERRLPRVVDAIFTIHCLRPHRVFGQRCWPIGEVTRRPVRRRRRMANSLAVRRPSLWTSHTPPRSAWRRTVSPYARFQPGLPHTPMTDVARSRFDMLLVEGFTPSTAGARPRMSDARLRPSPRVNFPSQLAPQFRLMAECTSNNTEPESGTRDARQKRSTQSKEAR
jgi:hypothetical protein